MTEQDQIKALAELDGFELRKIKAVSHHEPSFDTELWFKGEILLAPPNYLTSYDAIIPLVQKESRVIPAMENWFEELQHDWLWLKITPQQLCEALLRATGKWTA